MDPKSFVVACPNKEDIVRLTTKYKSREGFDLNHWISRWDTHKELTHYRVRDDLIYTYGTFNGGYSQKEHGEPVTIAQAMGEVIVENFPIF